MVTSHEATQRSSKTGSNHRGLAHIATTGLSSSVQIIRCTKNVTKPTLKAPISFHEVEGFVKHSELLRRSRIHGLGKQPPGSSRIMAIEHCQGLNLRVVITIVDVDEFCSSQVFQRVVNHRGPTGAHLQEGWHRAHVSHITSNSHIELARSERGLKAILAQR